MVLSDSAFSIVLPLLVVLGLLVSLAVVREVDAEVGAFIDAVRDRFILGVPWGTVITIGIVLAVYLFVQGGASEWNDPVTIPFRAWSYFYPTGMLFGGLAHNSTSHLIGNLTATVVLGPLAEYVWGHYPQPRRGRDDDSLATFPAAGVLPGSGDRPSWLLTPWIRACVIFPAVLVAVAVLTTVFAIGPVIGFSGAVFALGGFALLRYPLATILAFMVRRAVSTVHSALTDPVVIAGTSASPPSAPSWASIAVQGHALGIITGVLLGIGLLWYRNQRPPAGRLWLAAFIYGIDRGLWAVYWFLGDGEFILHRGVGVLLVTILALLIVTAATAPNRSWFPDATGETMSSISWRSLGLVALILGLALLAGPSILPNITTPGEDAVPNEQSIEVEDYEVTYAENARNQMIPPVNIPYFDLDQQTNVTTSGVIVISEERGIWTQSVSRQRLAFSGSSQTHVGGVGWREDITATRTGYTVVGNSSVYTVDLAADDGEELHVFEADNSTAQPTVANRTVTLIAHEDGFDAEVRRDGESLGRTQVPEANESVRVGGIDIVAEPVERSGGADRTELFVENDGTRVRIAVEETYN